MEPGSLHPWLFQHAEVFVSSPGQKMEFRTCWHDTSYVRENYVFGGSYLTVQDDCNVVVYNTSHQALWSTQTGCPW